jgi:hypothetical protein
MLGAIENKLAARAVVGLVRLGFACMDAAERIARWAKARNPSIAPLVDEMARELARKDRRVTSKGGSA